MKLALQASKVRDLEELRTVVVLAEQAGCQAVFMPDHLVIGELAVGPALAVASQLSATLELGTLVYANDFRHPLLCAREMATLQVLSGGRAICGVGAGWHEGEYRAAGIPLDPPAVRIARLEEALVLLRQAWSGEPFSFQGEFYQVTGYAGLPVPASSPRLLVGGGGRKILTLGARHADLLNLSSRIGDQTEPYSDEMLAEQVGWVREVSPSVELSVRIYCARIGDYTEQALAQAAEECGYTLEQARRSPIFLLGTESEARERLLGLERDLGINLFVFSQYGCDFGAMAPFLGKLAPAG